MIKKGDTFKVNITDFTQEGLGIGKIKLPDSESFFPLFIKDSAIGDVLEVSVTSVKKNLGYARIIKIISASVDRKEPVCPVARQCGGCQIRHIKYSSQLKWKQTSASSVMERIGGVKAGTDYEILPVIGMENPLRYRNKAQYPVRETDGDLLTGFFAGRTHSVIPVDDCLIEPKKNKEILDFIKLNAKKYGIDAYDEKSGKGILRHVMIRNSFKYKGTMICLVVNSRKGDKKVFNKLLKLEEIKNTIPDINSFIVNYNPLKTNVILGEDEDVIFGEAYITDGIGKLDFRISSKSFFQVNPVQTYKLYSKVLEFAALTGNEIVWDMYCGTGTISLFLAGRAKSVLGVEYVRAAVEDARINAEINKIENAVFLCGKAEDIQPDAPYKKPDVVVVDPPRKGCAQELLEAVHKSGAKRLVYVSCNPATLARDTALLIQKDFSLKKLQPVDMFPETTGIENVALFERK